MVSLDELKAKALAIQASTEATAKAKAKLKEGRLSERERDEIADTVRRWESAHDYQAVALVFREVKYVCTTCDSYHFAGGQVMQKEKHLRLAGTHRYVQVGVPYRTDLPRLRDHTEVKINMCGGCAVQLGDFPGGE